MNNPEELRTDSDYQKSSGTGKNRYKLLQRLQVVANIFNAGNIIA